MEIPPLPPASRAAAEPVRPDPDPDTATRAAAKAFEASFIAEMLKGTGLGAQPESFGGGAGEEAFGSFLTQEYARLISERGGFGLAEQIFETLKQKGQGR